MIVRKVTFDTQGLLCNAYGLKIPLEASEDNFYAHLNTEQTYTFDDTYFFVAKGFGDIAYKELPMEKPSFSKVLVQNLDYFIQYQAHSATSYDEIAQIENFVELFNFNNDLIKPKIYTEQYNQLINQLLGLKDERYYKL